VVAFLPWIIYDVIMMNPLSRNPLPFDSPASYQIIVQGRIDPAWSERLEGMRICQATDKAGKPIAALEGELSDQAALAGVLNAIYEMHLAVISVERLDNVDCET
jgi:hypothetical protein